MSGPSTHGCAARIVGGESTDGRSAAASTSHADAPSAAIEAASARDRGRRTAAEPVARDGRVSSAQRYMRAPRAGAAAR